MSQAQANRINGNFRATNANHKQAPLFTAPQTQTSKNDRYTPKWIFDTIGLRFDLDVAAPPGGVPWIPADNYFTQADDGLAQPWHGRVWINPPYTKPEPWANKFLEHGNGFLLVPVSNANWHRRVWANPEARAVLMPDLKFVIPTELSRDGRISHQVILWAIGDENIKALNNFGTVVR